MKNRIIDFYNYYIYIYNVILYMYIYIYIYIYIYNIYIIGEHIIYISYKILNLDTTSWRDTML